MSLFTDDQIQMIRSERKDFEQTQQISDKLLELMYEQNLFKLLVPQAFGGKMLDLPQAVNIFQEASRIEGNFGWLVTVGSGGGMFVPNMTEEAARRFYSPRQAVVAGSGFPAGKARPVEGGYNVNGKWFYCSGSQYATLFTASCVVENRDESSQEILAMELDPEQVNVLDDWDAFGLKGTSSHSIQVVDQFVPSSRVFSLFEHQNDYAGLVHTYPFMMFSEASFAAVSLGIGRHFLEEVEAILERNKAAWQKGSGHRYTFLKGKLDDEKGRWKRANEAFHEAVRSSWEKHVKGEELSETLQKGFSVTAKRGAATAVYCANNLFRYIGMQAVMEGNALNQIWRDLHTAAQHTFLTPRDSEESTPY
ncbi:Indole-3-acetate monooxygenase [Lentibacillus sp. JNUCC-1]|uniref:acyl-CoA dehydrogenase family protein n=1 Tax=Lentibacillus sp. JNUCC-1 TaxID=2654513 RepID=UPI0012E8AAF6|nr:acyl-CoA dehydrogenase family protein [Lentibacillus sp. JNUCC-1]MUV37001.1 Indole-3-acetate monooxygenase [Lentibacillus sp. JNUCC-1]